MADEYRNFWLVSTCERWAGGQRWKAFCKSFTKQQFLGKVNPSAASTRSSIFRHLLQHGWGTSFCPRPQAMGHAIGYARKKHNYFTLSYPHHDIYTFCCWQILWHSIWHIFWHLSGISSGILSGICSGISSGTLSGISSGTLSGISSGTLSGKSSGVCSGKHYLAYLLAFYLTFYLAYLLAFYLAYLLAFYLANILALYLAYLLAYLLAFYHIGYLPCLHRNN